MSRPLRIEYPGAIYHITSRGNDKKKIFCEAEDRKKFLEILNLVKDRYHWICHGYCLMDNHYHLIIETPEGNLSKGMRQLNGIYTQGFNKRRNRTGHIFQGRYKSILIEKDSHLLEVCRYIVLNPVRAGMIKSVEQWKWSSYQATAGISKPVQCLTVDWILGCFHEQKGKARKNYIQFVSEGIGKASIMKEVKAQCILGTDEFLAEFEDYLTGLDKIPEFSKNQRYLNRPSLEKIFSKCNKTNRAQRDKLVKKSVLEYGYS